MARSAVTPGVLTPPINEQDHRRGPLDAPYQMVEFGDFECPFCGEAYPALKRLVEVYQERLLFVFRHFPIVTHHPHALHAAEGAEAAAKQGLFWEMHDTLFENQDHLEDEDLLRYAGEIGCDVEAFQRDRHDPEVLNRVRDDVENGLRSGVIGTPTFFVNGVKREGILRFEELEAALLGKG